MVLGAFNVHDIFNVYFCSEREGREGRNIFSEEEYELEIYEDYYEPEYYFEDYQQQFRTRRDVQGKGSNRKKRKKEKTKAYSTKIERKIGRS